MKASVMLFMLMLLSFTVMVAQEIPVIQAKSREVSILQDKVLKENGWRIVPEVNPDVFITSAKKVTFYTDIDSISFDIHPDTVYDFVIVLKGKDSAHTRITYEPSKLDILKQGKTYNHNDTRAIPAFSYQSAKSKDLKKLRKALQLDSIAGDGEELTKIFNLMHWVHRLVKHDGNSDNPTLKNAVDLINVCRTQQRGVNCRMLAIILNECYLAMGIPSRYITCMPKETNFKDCHVINSVYSTELEKWIWIDPTFDAYVMDETGQLLSIPEVRNRLIHDQPLVLNADANWNLKSSTTKAYYLDYYMAKNLYRMQAPVYSAYNAETWSAIKKVSYVELIPLDGLVQSPQHETQQNTETGVTFTYYKTNNPDLFWTQPN